MFILPKERARPRSSTSWATCFLCKLHLILVSRGKCQPGRCGPSIPPEKGRQGLELKRFKRTLRQAMILPIVACLFLAGVLIRSEEHTSELQSLRHLVCRL